MQLMQLPDGRGFKERLNQLLEKKFTEKDSPAELLFYEAGWIGMHDVLILFGISKRTLQSWRTKRLVAHSRIEKVIVYNIYDILATLERNKVERIR